MYSVSFYQRLLKLLLYSLSAIIFSVQISVAQCVTDAFVRINNSQNISLITTPGTIDICDVLDPLEIELIFDGVSDVVATIDWGDGTSDNISSGNSFLHVYAENLPATPEYIIDISITQADGSGCSENIIKPISINRRTFVIGSPINFAGGLACLPPSGDFNAQMNLDATSLSENSTIEVDWGDGTVESFTEQQLQDNGGTLLVTHLFSGVTVADAFDVAVTSQNSLNSGCVLQPPVIELTFQNEINPSFDLSGDICESGGTISINRSTVFPEINDIGEFRWEIVNVTTGQTLLETSYIGAFIVSNPNFAGNLETFDLTLLDTEISNGDVVEVRLYEVNSCGEIIEMQPANILALPNTDFISFNGDAVVDPALVVNTCIRDLTVEFSNTTGFTHEWVLVDGHGIVDPPNTGLTSFTPPTLTVNSGQVTSGNKTLFIRSINDVSGVACENFIKLELAVDSDVVPDFTLTGDLADNCGQVSINLDALPSTNLVNGDQIFFEFATNAAFTQNLTTSSTITFPTTEINNQILSHVGSADDVTYFIRMNVQSSTGCSFVSSIQQLDVREQPSTVGFFVQLVNGTAPTTDQSNFIFCDGDRVSVQLSSIASGNSIFNWRTPTGATVDDATPNNSAFVFIVTEASDNAQIEVEEDLNGCTFTTIAPTFLTVNPIPGAVSISATESVNDGDTNDGNFCEDLGSSSITLSAIPTNPGSWDYQWFKDGVSLGAVATNSTLQLDEVSESGDYTVTVSGLGACLTDQVDVTPFVVDIQPELRASLSVTAGSTVFCEGAGSVTLTATEAGGLPFLTNNVQWYKFNEGTMLFEPEIITTAVRTFTLPSQSGRYQVQLFDNGFNQCPSALSSEVEITINEEPNTPNIGLVSGFSNVTCADPAPLSPDVTLELLNPTAFTPLVDFTINWRLDGTIVTDADSDPTTLAIKGSANNGNYTVEVVSVAAGCVSNTSNAINVIITDPPTQIPTLFSAQTTSCVDEGDIILSITNNPGGLGQEWFSGPTSNFNDATAISTAATLVVSDATASTLYYFARFIADPSGSSCEGTASAGTQIKFFPLPSAPSITASSSEVCEGDIITLTATPIGGETEFRWYRLPDSSTPVGGSIINTIDINAVGLNQQYVARAVSSDGCLSPVSNTEVVNILELPDVNLSISVSDNTICDGESIVMSIPGSLTGLDYELIDDVDNVLATSTGTGATLELNSGSLSAGTLNLRVRATTNGSTACTEIVTNAPFSITILEPAPTAELITTDTNSIICNGDVIPFQLNVPTNARPPFSVVYSINGGSDITATTSSISPFTFSSAPINASSTVELISVEDAEGCSVLSVSTSPNPLVITVDNPTSGSLTAASAVCINDQIEVTLNVTGGIGPFDYEIAYTGFPNVLGTTSSLPQTVLLPGSITSATTISLVSITSANGCSVPNLSADVAVAVNDPQGIFTISDPEICEGDSPSLSVSVTNGSGPYTFSIEDGSGTEVITSNSYNSGNIIAIPPTYIPTSGSETFTLVAFSDNSTGCNVNIPVGLESVSLLVNSIPATPSIAVTSMSNEVCFGETVTLEGPSISPGDAYQWVNSIGTVISTNQSVDFTVIQNENYRLKIIGDAGDSDCESNFSTPVNVVINALPSSATITEIGSLEFCDDGGTTSVTLVASAAAADSFEWFETSNPTTVLSSAATLNLSSTLQSGSYSVRAFNSVTNCESASTPSARTVNIIAPPVQPTVEKESGLDDPFCEEGSNAITLRSSVIGDTYRWFRNGTEIIGVTSRSITLVEAIESGDYTVSVTNNSPIACEGPISNPRAVTIVSPPPTPTVNISGSSVDADGQFCDDNGTTSVTLISSVTGTSYNWYFDDGLGEVQLAATTQEITLDDIAETGDYSVEVVGTAPTSCISSRSAIRSVLINAIPTTPTIQIISGTTEFCADGGTTSVTLGSSVAGTSYRWYKDGVFEGAFVTQQITLQNATATGTYTVEVVGPAPTSCVSSESAGQVILINNPPVQPSISLTGSGNEFCEEGGNTVNLNASSINANESYRWFRDLELDGSFVPVPDIQGGNTSSIALNSISQSGDYRLQITGNSPTNCESLFSATENILIKPIPAEPVIQGIDELCEGTTNEFYFATPVSGASYNWNIPAGVTATLGGGSGDSFVRLDLLTSGSYNLGLSVTVAGCISVENLFNIDVLVPSNTSVISGDNVVCENTAGVTYSVVETSGSSYQWAVPGGAFITSGQGTNEITVQYGSAAAAAGSPVLEVTETNSAGCASIPVSLTVTVNPNPTASIGGTFDICEGESFDLEIDWSGELPLTVDYSIDGVSQLTPITIPVGASDPYLFNANPSITTIYTLDDVNDNNSCSGTAAGLTRLNVSPAPMFEIGPNQAIPQGTDITFIPETLSGTFTSINWAATPASAGTFDNATATSPTFTPLPAFTGSITIEAIISDGASICPDVTDNLILTVNAAGTIFAGNDLLLCNGDIASFIDAARDITDDYDDYSWSSNRAGSFSNPTISNPANDDALDTDFTPAAGIGDYTITLEAIDTEGALPTSTSSFTLTVNEVPDALLINTSEKFICEGENATLTVQLSGNNMVGPWSFTWQDNLGNTGTESGISISSFDFQVPGGTNESRTYTIQSVNEDDGLICTNSSPSSGSVVVTKRALPTAEIINTDIIGCVGISTDVTVELTGIGPWNIRWSDDGGATSTQINDITTSPFTFPVSASIGATTYTIEEVTEINGVSCLGTIIPNSKLITINPDPTVSISGAATICEGQSTDLTFDLTGEAPWSVTYNDGAGDIVESAITSSPHTVSVSPTVNATYTLVSVSDNNSCVTTGLTQSALVQVRELPTVDAGSSQSVPVNTVVSLTPTVGGSFTAVLWDDGGAGGAFGNSATSNTSYTPPAGFVGDITLTLTIGDGSGPCDDDISEALVVTYNAAGSVVAGNDEVICNGDAILLDDVVLAANYERYTWSSDRPGAFSMTTLDNPASGSDLSTSFTASNGIGDYIVTLTAVDLDAILPDASATLTVSVDALPTVTISGATTICEGQSTDLTFNLTGAAPWSIVYNDGTSDITEPANSTVHTVTVSPTGNTTYTLVSITDDNSCVTSGLTQSALVQVRELPTVDAGSSQSVPVNTVVSLTPTVGGSFTSVLWDDGGAGGAFGNPATSNTSYTPPVGFVGDITLTLTIGDAAGPCDDDISDALVVTYNAAGSVVAGNDEVICNGEAILLDDVVLTANYERYTWSSDRPGAFSLTTLDNPASGSDLATSFTPSNGIGDYIVTLTAVDLDAILPNASATLTVAIDALPTVSISGATTICEGQSTDLTFDLTGEAPWSVTYNDGSGDVTVSAISSSPHTVSVSPVVNTTYTLVSVSDNNSCTTSGLTQSALVQVRELPTVDAGSSQSVPVNTVVSLTPTVGGSFTSVLWDDGGAGGAFGNPATSNTSYTPPAGFVGDITLTLTIGDAAGPCDDDISDALVVTYNAAGSVVAGNDEVICNGEAILLDDVVLAANYERYTWSSDRPGAFSLITLDNPVSSSDLTTSFTPSNGIGDYIVTLTAVDLNAILPDASATLIVAVDALPTVSISGAATICEGQSTDLTFDLTGEAPWSVTYNDGPGDIVETGIAASPHTISVSPVVNTTYTLVSVSDNNSCVTSGLTQSALVQVRELPNVDAGSSQSVPLNTVVSLTPTVGGSFTSVLWDDGGAGGAFGNSATSNTSYTPPAGFVGDITLTLTIGDAAGPCDDDINDALVVTYNAAGSVVAGNDEVICNGEAILLDDVVLAANYERYTWTSDRPGAFSLTTLDNPVSGSDLATSFTPSNGIGDYIVTLTAVDLDAILPDASATITVSVDALPTVSISGAATICEGQSTDLTFTLTGAAPWSVTYNDGAGDIVESGIAASPHTISVSPVVNTTYTLVSVSDNNSCVTSGLTQSALVQVRELPTVDAGSSQSVPVNTVISLTPTVGGSFTSVLWDDGGAGGSFGNPATSNTSYTPPAGFVGDITLTLTIGDGSGPCDDDISDALVVTYNAAGSVVAGNDEVICNGDAILLDDVVLAANYERYTWTSDRPGAFSLTTLDNPASGSDLTTSFTPSNGIGDYIVTLTAVDLDAILPDASATLTVAVDALPTVSISGAATICEGQSTDLTFNLTGAAPWSIVYNDGSGDVTVSGIGSSPHSVSVSPVVNTTYTLVSVSDNNSCTTSGLTQSSLVQVRELPTVDAGSSQSVPVNTVVSLTPTVGGSFTSVLWDDSGAGGSFGNPATSNTSYTPPAGFVGDITLTLTIGDGSGPCDDDISDALVVTYNAAGSVVAGNDEVICNGDAILLDDVVLAANYERYTWTSDRPGAFSLTTLDNPALGSDLTTSFTPSNGIGDYIVTLTAVDLDAILPDASATLTVSVDALPTVSISGAATICEGQSTDLTFNLTGAAPWSVIYNDGTSDITVSGIGASPHAVTVSPVVNTTYTLVSVSDNNSCVTTGLTQSALVQVSELPTVDAGSSQSVPVNTVVSLTPTVGGSFTSVLWDDGGAGGSFGNSATSNTSYTPPAGFVGDINLTLTIGDAAGPCDDDINDALVVTYNAAGNIDAGDDQLSCDGATISVVGTLDAGYEQLLWTSNRAGSFSASTSLASDFTPTNGSGIYILTLTAIDNEGFLPTISDELEVDFHVLPVAQFINTSEKFICEIEVATLTLQLSGNSSNGPWNVTYEDDLGNSFSETSISTSPHTFTVPGTVGASRVYTITGVTENDGVVCDGSIIGDPVVVTKRANATAEIVSSDLDVCFGEPTEITVALTGAGPWNLRWSDNGGVTSLPINGITSSPHTFSVNAPIGATSYSIVSISELNNVECAGDIIGTDMIITVNEIPTASLSGNATICFGEAAALTFNLTGAAPWDVNYSDGTNTFFLDDIPSSPFVVDVSPTVTTSYSLIDVSDGNSNSCFGSVSGSALVQVQPLPVSNPTIDLTEFCSEEFVQVNGNPSGGSGVYIEHLWTGSGASFLDDISIPNPIFQNTVTVSTDYELIYSLRDQNTCEVTSNILSFTVNPKPEVNPSASALAVCSGESVDLFGNSMGGTGSLDHIWTGSGSAFLTSSTVENPVFSTSVLSETTFILTYQAEDDNGCSDEKSISITVFPEITIDAIADQVICQGGDLVINAVVEGKFTNLQWTSDLTGSFDNPNSINTVFIPDVDTFGTGTITLTASDVDGICASSSVDFTLEIKEEITIFAGDDEVVCEGEVVNLSGTATGNFSTVEWTTSGTGTLTNVNSLTTTYEPAPDEIGIVNFTLTASDATTICEPVSDVVSVNYNSTIDIALTADEFSCQTDPILVEGIVIGSFTELNWSSNNAGTFSNSNTAVTTYFPSENETGFVELTLTATDGGGICPNTSESIIIEIKDRPIAEAGDNVTINEGETAVIEGNVTGNFNRVEWSTNGTGTFNPTNEVVTVYTPSAGEEGFIILTLTAFDDSGICSTTSDQMILEIIPSAPVAQFSMDVDEGCLPLEVQFTNESLEADDDGYFWDFGDGSNVVNEINTSHTYQSPGTFTITLTATNSAGVTDVATMQVTVNPLPIAAFSIDPLEYFIPDPLQITNSSQDAVSYFWDFGDGNTSDEFQPNYVYETPGEYTVNLTVTSADDCISEFEFPDFVTILEGGTVQFPNAFTPSVNGPTDGRIFDINDNDIFLPVMTGVKEFNMRIFNRWGARIFESNDPEIGWDGYLNGELATSGSYTYVVKIRFSDGNTEDKTGTITLVR